MLLRSKAQFSAFKKVLSWEKPSHLQPHATRWSEGYEHAEIRSCLENTLFSLEAARIGNDVIQPSDNSQRQGLSAARHGKWTAKYTKRVYPAISTMQASFFQTVPVAAKDMSARRNPIAYWGPFLRVISTRIRHPRWRRNCTSAPLFFSSVPSEQNDELDRNFATASRRTTLATTSDQ